ncbi:MAG: YiaA/YiaB family inner membrane protein [Pseudomonadota bacterium]
MIQNDMQLNSPEWLFFVKTAFFIAFLATGLGVFLMPGSLIVKGYFAIAALFLVSTTFTLAKTLRDDFESQRFITRLDEARATQIIKEYSE